MKLSLENVKDEWPETKFNVYTAMLREFAKFQMKVDRNFSDSLHDLRSKMYAQRITPQEFWKQYKNLLIKIAEKQESWLKTLIKKADQEMNKAFNEAEKSRKKETPQMINLRLSE